MVALDYKKKGPSMKCIRPLKASLDLEGNIIFTSKKAERGLQAFEFECRKCLPCRLNGAREKAIRAIHEAKIHEDNIFLTLTYDDEHLRSPKLQYSDFQSFMKRLRSSISRERNKQNKKKWNIKAMRELSKEDRRKFYREVGISFMVTGEYGELNKRPHWHALIFNYRPPDAEYKYSTDRGDKVWTSKIIDNLWKHGATEFGTITIDSAGYVARYAAKKLVHGKDDEHDFHPIHKVSTRGGGIGKKWIEKYWQHTFENGFVVLPTGEKARIPRYYEDWFKKTYPEKYVKYLTGIKSEVSKKAEAKARKEEMDYLAELFSRQEKNWNAPRALTRAQVQETILKGKFKRLQERLKL